MKKYRLLQCPLPVHSYAPAWLTDGIYISTETISVSFFVFPEEYFLC